ncbi:MAG: 16S rRNA (guanine(966)-N(2))-methyltransferase RsmD [Eggerthellaceae bacterium]|nr:16S rRNA (guanine(966)-N(2))-methyltransferase RsmD [Eggerthellaceae bacterium]
MRIIAGEFKGRPLKAPKGTDTRPTVDRVRESLMSSILSARGTWEGAVVLDLFAGSGALGLEAISRGASYACLCDKSHQAFVALRTNAKMADSGRVRIVKTDVCKRLPVPPAGSAFDLVFLDPPYAMGAGQVAALIARLRQEGALAAGTIVSYEHDASEDPLSNEAFLSLELAPVTRKKFGSTVIDLLEMGNA